MRIFTLFCLLLSPNAFAITFDVGAFYYNSETRPTDTLSRGYGIKYNWLPHDFVQIYTCNAGIKSNFNLNVIHATYAEKRTERTLGKMTVVGNENGEASTLFSRFALVDYYLKNLKVSLNSEITGAEFFVDTCIYIWGRHYDSNAVTELIFNDPVMPYEFDLAVSQTLLCKNVSEDYSYPKVEAKSPYTVSLKPHSGLTTIAELDNQAKLCILRTTYKERTETLRRYNNSIVPLNREIEPLWRVEHGNELDLQVEK